MTLQNIQKFACILFFLGLGCRTNFNDFDRRIYVVEGLKKQNSQEEKISEQRKHPKHTQLPLVTIQEGIGIPDLLLKKTKFADVESKFGNQYIRNYFNYGVIEIFYESLGLSFIFERYSDEILLEIGIKSPFRAITSKGITLDKSTLQEAMNIYGENATWMLRGEGYYWCIKYKIERSRGIRFCTEKNPSIPEKPVDKTFYLKQKIQKIDIL
ncbi:Putative lipoprotein [Leptospira santarosai]|uniref:Lipoprotein n=1 Tax=Leptospira santarosai TaxID=28183 RepID=A0A0M2WWJ0_9LEPT|nr:Putative lipoprotein [Leptospira santarosai]